MTNNKNDTITPTLDRQREIYLKGPERRPPHDPDRQRRA